MKEENQPDEILELIAPTEADEASVLDYKAEHLRHGETVLHGGALLDLLDSYADWLKLVRGNTRRETVHPGWVPANTLLAVRRSDRNMVGIVDIRRELNDFLRTCGGHIGYGVRPSERRKGYATKILQLALEHCRRLGLPKVLISCYQDNIGSRRTIETCGGRKLRDFLYEDIPASMFQIDLADRGCRTITLREFLDADIPLLTHWLEQAHVQPWYEHPEAWLNEVRERRGAFAFLRHRIAEADGKPIGFCQYYDCFAAQEDWYQVNAPGQLCSIDYLIGEADDLKRGFGSRMVEELLREVRRDTAFKSVIIQPDEANTASRKLLISCGFHYNETRKYFERSLV